MGILMSLDVRYLATAVAVATGIGLIVATKASQPPGRPAPEFAFKTTAGQTIDQTDLPGKVTLVYLSGEGCPACNVAAPVVQDLADRYPEARLQIIGGDIWDDTPSQAKKTKKDKRATFPIISGARTLSRHLGSAAVPQFVLFDKKGRLRETIKGFPGQLPLEEKINTLLKEPKN